MLTVDVEVARGFLAGLSDEDLHAWRELAARENELREAAAEKEAGFRYN